MKDLKKIHLFPELVSVKFLESFLFVTKISSCLVWNALCLRFWKKLKEEFFNTFKRYILGWSQLQLPLPFFLILKMLKMVKIFWRWWEDFEDFERCWEIWWKYFEDAEKDFDVEDAEKMLRRLKMLKKIFWILWRDVERYWKRFWRCWRC